MEIIIFFYDIEIHLSHFFDYFKQGNGQEESSNKNLVSIMKKIIFETQRNWHKKFFDELWEDMVTPKREIVISPFKLIYGLEASIPLPLELLVYRLQQAIEDSIFQSGLDKRILYLTKLE